ncbi:hypothetical protein STEG23_030872 [Scotinomys teguina]
MCRLSWFLDPGGWSKTAAVGLYFIFPEICTLSLLCRDLKKGVVICIPTRSDMISRVSCCYILLSKRILSETPVAF